MADQSKTIQDLTAEIDALKERIRELETFQNEGTRAQQASRKSEVLFEKMLQGVPSIAIQGYGPDGTTVYWNRASERLYGYSEKEAIGKNLLDLIIPPEMREDVEWAMRQMAETGDAVPAAELSLMRKDGSRVPVFSSHVIVPGQDPVLFCIDFDLTEHKRAVEALRESRDLLDTTQRLAHIGGWEWDVEQQAMTWTDETYRIHGMMPGEALADSSEHIDSSLACYDPADRPVIQAAFSRCAEKGQPYDLEFPLTRIDGRRIWIKTMAHAVKNDDRVIKVMGNIMDITERKRTEERIAHLAAMVDLAPSAITVHDFAGSFLCSNHKNLEIHGYSREELMALNLRDIDVPSSATLIEERMNLIRNGGEAAFEVEHYCKDGAKVPLEVFGKLVDWYGKPALLSIGKDIRERKRAEAEREKLQAQLSQAQKLESIGTLAGGIAHDFNNLLMGILGHASLMMLDLDPSHPHYERLKHVEESVASGADLTRQLLGFARGGRYDVKPVSMNDIVEKSCAMFSRTKKEISIHLKYAKAPCVVEADRSQMEQVFMNLFVNAWQAMPGGGDMFVETEEVVLDEAHAIPGRVAPGRYVKVTVTDTGVGMDEQTKERIFDPFFSTKGMGRGTGLGLATVYGILHGHGGMITVESEPGRGSRFILCLPASGKDPVGEMEAAGAFLCGTETILLVDDEPMVMEVSRELLESLGYRVYVAGSGQEAVSVYLEKKSGIDLVILDMVMPGISGGETFDRLRQINPGIKVLLASGYSIDGQAQEILDRGCNGFIQKPFHLKELSRRVREMLDD